MDAPLSRNSPKNSWDISVKKLTSVSTQKLDFCGFKNRAFWNIAISFTARLWIISFHIQISFVVEHQCKKAYFYFWFLFWHVYTTFDILMHIPGLSISKSWLILLAHCILFDEIIKAIFVKVACINYVDKQEEGGVNQR